METLEATLRGRARAAPAGGAGAEAWLDLGRYLAWAEPGDRDGREATTALETARDRRPTIEVLRLLADVARDEDERRRALEAALATTDEPAAGTETPEGTAARRASRALLLARLGDAARGQRRDAVALARWREALAVDPACWPATLALADEEQGAGPAARGAGARRGAAARRRGPCRACGGSGRDCSTPRAGRATPTVSSTSWRRRSAGTTSSSSTSSRRARAASAATPRFIARLAEAAALRPDLPSLSLELARALEGAGDGARARGARGARGAAARRRGRARAPRQAAAPPGPTRRGAGRLRAALALRPQDPGARALPRGRRARGPRARRARRPARIWRAATPPRRARSSRTARAARRPPRATPSCCSIGASCACTPTGSRRPSRSASSPFAPTTAPRRTRSSTCATRPASRTSRSARRASSGAARAARSRSSRRPSATTRISPSPGTASTTTTAPRSCASRAARRRRPRGAVRHRGRLGREPDGRLLRRPADDRRGDPQAPLGLHAHRAGEPAHLQQHAARAAASSAR